MRTILFFAVTCIAACSCAGHIGTENLRLPIIIYDPATYLSDIEDALSEPASGRYMYADTTQLADMDKEMLAYLMEQDAFIISLTDDDAKDVPEFIGIRDKEKGYLKYLNIKDEKFLYSLDEVIIDLYGNLNAYIGMWPEEKKHLFHEDPQGLYTFPIELYAINAVGYGNSIRNDDPVRYKAAVSFLRSSRPEWNDDTWAIDSTEIVRHSESVTGAFLDFNGVGRAQFENKDAGHFTTWVKDRLTYPDAALESAATGRVRVKFCIDMFGNLEDVTILGSAHPALDSAVFKVVSSSPEWTPATDIVGNAYSAEYIISLNITP